MTGPRHADRASRARVIGELLRERAGQHPDRPFLGSGDDLLTYGEVDERSERVAAGLAALGSGPGDRIAVISANRVEMLELFFACAKLGAVEVPLNVFLKGEFLRYQLQDSQATTLVADAAGYEAVDAMLEGLPALTRLVRLDDTDSDRGATSWKELRETSPKPPHPEVAPSSLMSILYTSGTTGTPKGCMLPHGWYMNHAHVAGEMLEYRSDDVLFTALPLYHGQAKGMVMGALVHHLTAWIDPIFSVSRILERFIDTNASLFSGVGAMGTAMLAGPPTERDKQHRLRAALMMPFTPEQQDAFKDRFGVTVLAQLYGQTECGAIAYSRLSESRNLASIGRAAPLYDVRLFDDDDQEVPVGEVGEICVRPKVPYATYLGYWRNPQATIEAWRNLWHHTGDFGRIDVDGFITFVDRKNDALRRRGENVSSQELERAIASYHKISEAAVHAVPSPMTEDDIKACIMLVAGAEVSPDELFDFFKQTLPYFTIPRYVEVLPALPKNATRRVMKHVLRERGVTDETWDLEAMGYAVARGERR